MNLIERAARWIEKRWRPSPAPITSSWLLSTAIAGTGQNVTPDVGMATSALFGCVRIISDQLSTIPVVVRNISDNSPAVGHPLNFILNSEMNSEMTGPVGRSCLLVNELLWGNQFAFIERDGADVARLWPLRSQSTSPYRYYGGDLQYNVVTGSATYTFLPYQMLHVPEMGYDGIVGLSRVRYAANAIGLNLSMEDFASKFFRNGGNLGGLLMLPASMKKDAVRAYVASWQENNAGQGNAFKVATLTDGIKYERVATEPEKAQLVDTRVFAVREIARFFGVPLHKLGDIAAGAAPSIEQLNSEFVSDCLAPRARFIESEWERKLLQNNEKGRLIIRHDFSQLVRPSTNDRYGGYQKAILTGWMTPNEARQSEGLPPMDGGDTLKTPLNMGTPGGDPGKPQFGSTREPADGGEPSEDD